MDIEAFFVGVRRRRFGRTFRGRQFFFTEASLTLIGRQQVKSLRKPATLSGEEVVVPKKLHGGKKVERKCSSSKSPTNYTARTA